MDLKTPLYDAHVRSGGKMVPFAGYLLPIQYPTGITAEHMAVRTKAGLFDVSHMGELLIKGPDALSNVQNLVTNDCAGMTDGQVKYSPMCNENGGVVDDLLVYKKGEEEYLLVVNAANHDKDVAWIQSRIFGDAVTEDISSHIAQIAIQGPVAQKILESLVNPKELPVKYYSFTNSVEVAGHLCLISKTGYTGENGYELYTRNENAESIWDALLTAGTPDGLMPCGLGARDTLRLEASMPLYGHEMDEDISPPETGLGFFVKMTKEDFIGKAAIAARGTPTIKRVGLEVTERGIARAGDLVLANGREIGRITSGTMCPYLKKAVAMALVDIGCADEGEEVTVEVRGKPLNARTVRLPFYKKA